jgi:hypothetical protein
MGKEVEVLRRDKMVEDSFKFIKEDYMVYCKNKSESPSVHGMLIYLNDRGYLDNIEVVKTMFEKKALAVKKPYDVVKEMALKYGIKRRSLWNWWDKIKVIKN